MKSAKQTPYPLSDDGSFQIVLSHYPDMIRSLQGNPDLVLSGHTHGGQITAFGTPLVTRSRIGRKSTRGVSIHKNTILAVSKGMGVSHYVPFRFFAEPDVLMIKVQPEN